METLKIVFKSIAIFISFIVFVFVDTNEAYEAKICGFIAFIYSLVNF